MRIEISEMLNKFLWTMLWVYFLVISGLIVFLRAWKHDGWCKIESLNNKENWEKHWTYLWDCQNNHKSCNNDKKRKESFNGTNWHEEKDSWQILILKALTGASARNKTLTALKNYTFLISHCVTFQVSRTQENCSFRHFPVINMCRGYISTENHTLKIGSINLQRMEELM